jgi:hypothetical protein
VPEYRGAIPADVCRARAVRDHVPQSRAKEGDSLQVEQLPLELFRVLVPIGRAFAAWLGGDEGGNFSAMSPKDRRARDFLQLASVHAASDENATREIIDKLSPEARDELHTMAHALTNALKAGPSAAGPRAVLSDFMRPEGALPLAASDAVPGLGRIATR